MLSLLTPLRHCAVVGRRGCLPRNLKLVGAQTSCETSSCLSDMVRMLLTAVAHELCSFTAALSTQAVCRDLLTAASGIPSDPVWKDHLEPPFHVIHITRVWRTYTFRAVERSF